MDQLRKKSRRDAKKQAILDEARRLMVDNGLEGLSLRKLAASLGVTPTAIYFYFKDKESIVRELCDEGLRILLQEQLQLADIHDPVERLYRHGLAYLDLALKHTDYFWILFVERTFDQLSEDSSLERGSLNEDPYAIGVSLAKQVVKLAKSSVKPEEFMHAFWAMVHGIACIEISLGNEDWVTLSDPREQYRFSYDLLVRGLGIKQRGIRG